MPFRVVDRKDTPAVPNDILLVKDNWNDWFIWVTLFNVIVVAEDGSRVDVGYVKIAREGMTREDSLPNLPDQFDQLGEKWFSIGQSENYYETLNELGGAYRDWFLVALRDCARDLTLLTRFDAEEVLHNSLLRDIEQERVRNRFNRLAFGNAILTPFAFKYAFPADEKSADLPLELTFQVTPGSRPPSNVHVLIGRNGVGKTRCFDLLSRNFLNLAARDGTSSGQLSALDPDPFGLSGHGFSGLVTVSFSPFDAYGPLYPEFETLKVRYAYIGLIHESRRDSDAKQRSSQVISDQARLVIKSRSDLDDEFVRCAEVCRSGARRARWSRALKVLEADPLFEEVNVSGLSEDSVEDFKDRGQRFFHNLSSGHSVVLLTISKLVELVEERSLILIDEPEGHLHPPLLSAFIRALSDLLADRNGVAVVATHSPVVLQEVPKDCVWILNPSGLSVRADRPEAETFGENVGVLTREVFGLEVIRTGFHRLISEASVGRSYDEVLHFFSGKLGAEGRGLARMRTLMSPGPPVTEEDVG